MVKILITTIQVNLVPLLAQNSPELSLLKFLPLTYHHSHFLAATLDNIMTGKLTYTAKEMALHAPAVLIII